MFANTFGGKFRLEIFLEHSWISSARLNSQIYKNYGQSSLPDEKFRLWHPFGLFSNTCYIFSQRMCSWAFVKCYYIYRISNSRIVGTSEWSRWRHCSKHTDAGLGQEIRGQENEASDVIISFISIHCTYMIPGGRGCLALSPPKFFLSKNGKTSWKLLTPTLKWYFQEGWIGSIRKLRNRRKQKISIPQR